MREDLQVILKEPQKRQIAWFLLQVGLWKKLCNLVGEPVDLLKMCVYVSCMDFSCGVWASLLIHVGS